MPVELNTIIPVWLIIAIICLLSLNMVLGWWLLFERRKYRKFLENNPQCFDLYNEDTP